MNDTEKGGESRKMVNEIFECRICGNQKLIPIINLGEQCLTGVFPGSREQVITIGPLELVKCLNEKDDSKCGLVQLRHLYNRNELYGDSYGYRSGLNISMVNHLKEIVDFNVKLVNLSHNDLVVDIGSNDGTLLNMYPDNLMLVGIDPTAEKFGKYYKPHIKVITDFFSSNLLQKLLGNKKAKIITSIAMFYDLENPVDFATQIYETMDEDGIWVSEQSYLPAMLEKNSYDTICQEHIEYYALKQLKWIFDKCDLKIIRLEFNEINGGSVKVITAKKQSKHNECTALIEKILKREKAMGLDTEKPFVVFRENIEKHKNDLLSLIKQLRDQDKTILGYGASTKGNVILQYCGITNKDIPYIAEVNEDKFGRYTPNTLIPIISEKEAKAMNPDFLLVLPWHFRENFIKREADYIKNGGKLIFPLPEIEIVGKY